MSDNGWKYEMIDPQPRRNDFWKWRLSKATESLRRAHKRNVALSFA